MVRRSRIVWKAHAMFSLQTITALCAASFLVSACASRTQQVVPYDTANVADRIAPSELLGVVANNAFDVVQQLRPQWLRPRGPTSIMEPEGEFPSVFIDAMRYDDLAVLRDIPVHEIAEIRFISGPDATTRWGTGVVAGVIEVIRKTKTPT